MVCILQYGVLPIENPMLKHQGLDGQQFIGPKGERLKFQTSMPSRQLVALGLKVKDSIQRR